jgi:twinkle protein
LQVFEDGGAKCFSCGAAFNFEKEYAAKNGTAVQWKEDNFRRNHFKKELTIEDILSLPERGIKDRLITREVAKFFGVRASYLPDGTVERFYFPFTKQGTNEIVGFKMKNPAEKHDMLTMGSPKNLFGIEHFLNGGKRIVLTEGEEDTLAVAQMSMNQYNTIYPVASMGGVNQLSYLLDNRDILRKFDEIVIWFDADEQGIKASTEAAKILGADKCKIVSSNEKDACDTLRKFGSDSKAGWRYIWDAKPYSPAGIVHGEDTWAKYQEFKNLKFIPWPPFLTKLGRMTYGRALKTITLFAAGTGVGKSTLLREDFIHLLETTDYKIGCIFLEEDVGETTAAIMGMHLNRRLGLPGVEITPEEELEAWQATIGQPGRVMLLDHQGSVSDGSLIDKIEFMALSGCRCIYLDHITIAVSDTEDTNVNTAIDKFMSELLKLVKRHEVWIGVVSHLRKVKSGEDSFETGAPISEDDLKGSGSLKQISFQTIALSRNKMSENEAVRHRTDLYLLKDRKTGETGPAGAYSFVGSTGRLKEAVVTEQEFEFIN